MWYGDTWGIGMWLMMTFMVLFWVAIIALVAWVIVRTTRGDSSVGSRRTPADIAHERDASGQISKEELDRIRKAL